MNKMIKGSVAGATGIALLMGGFGTYALWSDSETLHGNSVSAGVLDIAPGDVHWDDAATQGTDDWTPGDAQNSGNLLVPGDVVTRTQTFTITGKGKNLKGTVQLTGWNVTKNGFVNNSNDLLDVNLSVTSSDTTNVAPVTGTNNFTFSAPFNTVTLTTVVTYKFDPHGVTTTQEAQGATAQIADSTITIAQTPVKTS